MFQIRQSLSHTVYIRHQNPLICPGRTQSKNSCGEPVSRYILSSKFFIQPDRTAYPPGYFILGYFIRAQDILSQMFYPSAIVEYFIPDVYPWIFYPFRVLFYYRVSFVSPSSLHAFMHHVHNFWLNLFDK